MLFSEETPGTNAFLEALRMDGEMAEGDDVNSS